MKQRNSAERRSELNIWVLTSWWRPGGIAEQVWVALEAAQTKVTECTQALRKKK